MAVDTSQDLIATIYDGEGPVDETITVALPYCEVPPSLATAQVTFLNAGAGDAGDARLTR